MYTPARAARLACLFFLPFAVGCHSAYVMAHVRNDTGAAVTLVEVDYPSASFGKDELAAGATYDYRFKTLGSGNTSVNWTDAHQKLHTVKGPELHEGDEGSFAVTLQPATATFRFQAARP